MKDAASLTMAEAAAAIRTRQVSSVELTRALLDRIKRCQPKLNAFVRIDEEDALRAAAEADAQVSRAGDGRPLHGVPLAHKDMYYVEGKLAECGSKIRKGWVAPATSTAVARLQDAGALRVGALHMSEFAYGPTGHNEHLGPACNPWDIERITGGSSSGSGAAVAARLAYAALGSDTGGSIRLPAHFCGVTGLKTSYGRVSRANAMPLSFTLDTVGPLAQTAQDCGLILAAIAGPDRFDPVTASARPWDEAATNRPPNGIKIGIPNRFYVDDLEADVAGALEQTSATFQRLGVQVVPVDLPDQTLLSAAALIVLQVEATSLHGPWLRERPDDYGAQVRMRLQNGLGYSAVEYLEALRWRGPALSEHLAAIEGVDAVLAPASRAVAPTIIDTDVGGGAQAESAIQAITRFMRPVNFLGLPCLVAPAGVSKTGLPIGMQLIGRPHQDEMLIALGAAFQRETDYHRRHPQL